MQSAAYRADARVVVQHRNKAFADERLKRLSVGLLESAPTPEGGNVHEIVGEGYERQAAEFSPLQPKGKATRNARRIVFSSALSWPQAPYLGVFDADGRLLGYGRLERSPGSAGNYEVIFAPTSIALTIT